jgi:AcrR family transcriptional regulator
VRANSRQPRLGRRPGNGNAREHILQTATVLFAKVGYAAATMRMIAERAKVDVSLVSHYFGSKEELFLEAIHVPSDAFRAVRSALEGPSRGVGRRLAKTYFEIWENPESAAAMISTLRSTFAQARRDAGLARSLQARLMRQFVAETVGRRDPNVALRLDLAFSMLLGVAMARYVLRTNTVAEADVSDLIDAVAPTLQQILNPKVSVGSSGVAGSARKSPAKATRRMTS